MRMDAPKTSEEMAYDKLKWPRCAGYLSRSPRRLLKIYAVKRKNAIVWQMRTPKMLNYSLTGILNFIMN